MVIFIIANAILAVISYHLFNEGDLNRLNNGNDFRAELCGVDDLEDRPYMYFPDPYTVEFALCIERCPYYYVREYFCIYAEDHFTLRMDWDCYDSLPSTTYGNFCLPFTESAR